MDAGRSRDDRGRVGAGISRRRWLALIVLCVGQLMIVLDATVVNVALPELQRALHFSQDSLSWTINAYLITFGGLLLLAGRLGDLVGRKKVFLAGLGLFSAASLLCGMADGQALLIAARFAQGAGAALMSAMILGIVVIAFPQPAEKTLAMSVYTLVAASGGSLGLLLGGAVTQALGWHWIFFINVPIGVAALVLGSILIDGHEGLGIRAGMDVLGAVLVTAAAMVAVYGLVKAGDWGWGSARTAGFLGGAVLLAAAFAAWEGARRCPLIPLRIFGSRNLTGANLVRATFAVGSYSVFYLGTLYLQHVLGYDAMGTGLAFLPQTASVACCAIWVTPRLMARYGAKATLLVGLALVAAGLALFARVPLQGTFLADIVPGSVLVGVGAGLAFMPSITVAMADATPDDSGLASGVTNVSIQVGAALGLAVLASVSVARTRHLLAVHHGGAHPSLHLTDVALTGGYRVGLLVSAAFVGLAFVLGATIIRRRGAPAPAAAAAPAADLSSNLVGDGWSADPSRA